MSVVGKEKVTWMKLTTKPLDNEKNYSKVKKALCSLPQIQDQLYDEKSKETVTIKVVCCSPEKVADKLCKKGSGAILKIEYGIDNPLAPKPKEAEKPKEDQKPKEAEKPKPAPAASSSQTMTHYLAPPVGYPVYNGSYDGYAQQYGHGQGAPMYNGSYGYAQQYGHSQGPPMYNGSYDGYTQQYGYSQRTIHDSYGGVDDSSCNIM